MMARFPAASLGRASQLRYGCTTSERLGWLHAFLSFANMTQKRKIGPVQSVGRLVARPPARRAMATRHLAKKGEDPDPDLAMVAL